MYAGCMGRKRIDWQQDALCGDDIAFATLSTNEKKEYCLDCPVVDDCLDYGIVHELYGVWGAKSENERKRLRSRLMPELLYEAIDQDWLESHHLATETQYQETLALVQFVREKKVETRLSLIPPEVVENLLEFVAFAESQFQLLFPSDDLGQQEIA